MNATLGLIGLPLGASPLVYLVGHAGLRRPVIVRGLTLIGLLLAWVCFALAADDFNRYGILETIIGTIALRVDGISLLSTGVILTLSTVVTVYSMAYMAHENNEEKYYALLIAMTGAMIGLVCAADLFNLWVWFELMAISSYLLVAFYVHQPASLEAGVKYLVQSAIGSMLVLFGIAFVLARTGTLNLTAIQQAAATSSPLLVAAGALFVIGFGVKIALVPLHTWLPDAHAQAPSGISAMLSGVVIETALIALLRVLGALVSVTLSWGVLLMGFGALNMLVGNLLALRQTQVKRLLAFSSLSHIGYMLLGFGIAIYAGQSNGAAGGFFHLLTHGLMKGLAFLATGGLLYGLYLANGRHDTLKISDLSGAARRYPLAALSLSLAVLGLGGLPPLAGFMSKWQIFAAGFEANTDILTMLVIFAAFNSVLSLAYYAPLVNALYRQQPSKIVQQGQPLPLSMRLPLVVLAVLIVVIGVYPTLVSGLTDSAGAALLGLFR